MSDIKCPKCEKVKTSKQYNHKQRMCRSCFSNVQYHLNKSVPEKVEARREAERRRCREKREAAGLKPWVKHEIPLTEEEKKARNLEACKRYRDRNRIKIRERSRLWSRNNREKQTARWLERYRTDVAFNLEIKIRRRIHMALRGKFKSNKKADTTIALLGCSYNEFKSYIESKFTDGMTWDKCFNGEIHIDHIIPCSHFDLTDPEQQKLCFHYTNIQPLWAEDNLKKSNKILQTENK